MENRTTRQASSDASSAIKDGDPTLTGLDSKVGYLLRRAQISVFAEVIDILRELDLRPGQCAVLHLIGNNPGLSQSSVSGALGIKRANLVAVIDKLQTRGLVSREASRTDRRSHCLQLTAEGRRVLARATELQDRHEASIGHRLGATGYAELLRLLAKLA